ncbi:hypothetical protein D3C81_1729980 [compost metagenome]
MADEAGPAKTHRRPADATKAVARMPVRHAACVTEHIGHFRWPGGCRLAQIDTVRRACGEGAGLGHEPGAASGGQPQEHRRTWATAQFTAIDQERLPLGIGERGAVGVEHQHLRLGP